MLEFANGFSSSSRELLKRLSQCSFNYFTSSKSYYSRPHCAISFEDLPKMPKLTKNKLSSAAIAELREWRQQYGQSVRQKSVRNMSTKDRPGILPVNAYEEDIGSTELFDFSKLQSGSNVTESAYQEENTRIRHQRNKDDESNTSYVLAKVGEFAAVKHGYSPKELANKPCSFFVIKL